MPHPLARAGFLCAIICSLCADVTARVVINEIHPDPGVKTELVEFIELFNTGDAVVNVSGWQFTGGIAYRFPDNASIEAHGYLVVAHSPTAIASKFGVPALGPWSGRLENDGDKVALLNASGGIEDEVEYQLGFPWPTVGDPPGYSMELVHPDFDNQLGGNWRASTTSSAQSLTLLPDHSTWSFFRGYSEASTPSTAWRLLSFDDSGWESGPAPIGYEPANGVAIGTSLPDMNGNYVSFFMRRTFVVENPSAIGSLAVEALYDDGFKLWINGSNLLNQALSANEVACTNVATGGARENNSYTTLPLRNPAEYLRRGTNVIAVQVHNVQLSGSSDCFFDCRLITQPAVTCNGPTPGRQNCVFASNVPPQIRQVDHSPREPRSTEPISITARITDPEGVAGVNLRYQVVAPGNYIALGTAAYANTWTSIGMNDSGVAGDVYAGDSVYTAVLPAMPHRTLVRYRISAADGSAAAVTVPYPDDPEPNFGLFVYDGIPAWSGAVQPGVTPVLNFGTNVMAHLPAVHLIANFSAVSNATWGRYSGESYNWIGTLVYDGKVYDHIHYRARGGVWRYAMVKNMWKFDFNTGHDFQMRDDYGQKLKTRWTKLNLGASIQQGNYGHRGEQGMFESVGFRLFNLAGVPGCKTTFLQFRVIDDALESDPATQYEGDFWGVYLAIEQEDSRFLDEHDLPDGNFYKMDSQVYPYPYGDLNNQGATAATDKSDLTAFVSGLNANSPAEWWPANWWIENGCSYQAIVQGIHHYDIGGGKNYFYYLNPETRLWSVIPWDLDLTWANNMYDAGNSGGEPFKMYAIPKTDINMAYKNRVRELRDLLFNTDQAWQLIDEYARLLRGTNHGLTILDADRCMWDYNPKMLTLSSAPVKAGHGLFYQWPNEPEVSKEFQGCVQLMKNYISSRSAFLDSMVIDGALPAKPSVSYTGPTNYPLNRLTFTASPYSGANPFSAIRWRLGEVTDPNSPVYDPNKPRHYEVVSLWETSGVFSVTVPTSAVKVGHAYRVRVRMQDTTGRWSRWSAPAQFVTDIPDNAGALTEHLRVTELMFNPPGGSDYEFIELRNTSQTSPLNLEGANFTSGIDFSFPAGATLEPGEYLLLIKGTNGAAFRAHYGLPDTTRILGPYLGSLANEGEELTLKTGSGGAVIFSFDYAAGRGWPIGAEGAGHSLVPLSSAENGQATGSLDYPGNWRDSTFRGGSPGDTDATPPAPGVLLNEVTAHTDYHDPSRPEYDSNDWIELFNTTGTDIALSGWYLSDDPVNPKKWALPAMTLPQRAWTTFDEVSGFHAPITSGFGIDKAGEQLLLSFMPGGSADRVVDAVSFKGQENGVSLGRYPDGGGYWFTTLRTSNTMNIAISPSLLINEVMYHPPDFGTVDNTRDEFIEILNATSTVMTLQDSNGVWRLDGGISFTFPTNTFIAAGGALLVVNFDPNDQQALATFRSVYPLPEPAPPILGPYAGKLGNRSDRVALEKPQLPDLPGEPYSWVIVDEVIYGNQNPWPVGPNGTGPSLHRLPLAGSGNNPANWLSAAADPGVVVATDRDGDGLPDAWEFRYGLNPGNNADAVEDSDDDGMTNLQEFRSGTDPRDANSVLRFDSVTLGDEFVTLTFTALENRSYTIQASAALGGLWENLRNIAAGTGRIVDVPVATTNGIAKFYRLVTPALP